MNVLLLAILSLSLAVTGVQAEADLCALAFQQVRECAALQCPLEFASGACAHSGSVTTCEEAEKVCLSASSCCGGGCGLELEAVIKFCLPDADCERINCVPEETSTATFSSCENATIIEACDALNRTCANQTSADGKSREFCDQCQNATIWNFVSDKIGDCYPIEAITYEQYLQYFDPFLQNNELTSEERAALLKAVALNVSAHNSQIPRPKFFLQVNSLSHLTEEELRKRNGARNASIGEDGLDPFTFNDDSRRLEETLPESVDWSQTGAVTKVKNQQQCGCCWALATVGAIEAAVWRTTNETFQEDLSWQQLISCDNDNGGCNGGNVLTALQYTEDENVIGGMTSLSDYPFTDDGGTTTKECTLDQKELAVDVIKLGLAVSSTDPSDVDDRVTRIKEVLSKTPMAVLMSANCNTFYNYQKGIMTDDGGCSCNSGNCIDHAVLMVGYDDTTNPASFKIKNSWGTGWGESGYFRIAQTVDQSTMQYGLFGLLYQASGAVDAINTTVADPSSAATSIQAGSVATATVLTIISSIILGLTEGVGL